MPKERPISKLDTSASEEREDTFDKQTEFESQETFQNPLFEERFMEVDRPQTMANEALIAELNLLYADMGPGEKRLFNFAKEMMAVNNLEEKAARINKELKTLLAAQLTSWQAVETSEGISKLIRAGFSREEAETMVEKEEDRLREKRKGSNPQRSFNYRGRGGGSYRQSPGVRSGQSTGQSGHKK